MKRCWRFLSLTISSHELKPFASAEFSARRMNLPIRSWPSSMASHVYQARVTAPLRARRMNFCSR